MKVFGYDQSRGDHTLFIKHSKEGKVTLMLVYVDDMIVTSNDKKEQGRLKERLTREFEIKDLGVLKYFLGIEVAYSKVGIFLSQRKYVLDLLAKIGLTGGKGSKIPIEPNSRLWNNPSNQTVDKGRYQRLVGRLIYLSHTRPDIAFPVNLVSQFIHSPTK